MKINCGMSYRAKLIYWSKWHRFFAIWPRRVGEYDCRWLEFIERRDKTHYGYMHNWEYRSL